jgi:flagellar biosynthesis/type III secretory pathway chaperone
MKGDTTKFNLAKEKEDNQELLKIIKEIKEWLSSNIEDNNHENDLVEDNIKLLQYILELELVRAKKKNHGIEVKPWSC